MIRHALISECGLYRYWLSRVWDTGVNCLRVCMLNPSTADAATDDATIRWLIGYAKKLHYGGISVVNLCALRSTDPRRLLTADDPVGPHNRTQLRFICGGKQVLCAWGNWAIKVPQAHEMMALVRRVAGEKLCLAETKLGQPRHPLRMSHDTIMTDWPIAAPAPGTRP